MNKIICVYHGSSQIIQQPVIGKGNPNNDYGLGFYCTESVELAKEWACSAEADGFANRYAFDLNGLSILSLTGGNYYRSKISRNYLLFEPKCRNNAEITYT